MNEDTRAYIYGTPAVQDAIIDRRARAIPGYTHDNQYLYQYAVVRTLLDEIAEHYRVMHPEGEA